MGFFHGIFDHGIFMEYQWGFQMERSLRQKTPAMVSRFETWLRNPHDKYGGLAVKNPERKAGDFPTSHLFSLAKAISGMGYHGDATAVSEKRCSSWFYHVLSTIEGNIFIYDPVTKHSQKGNF